MNYERTNIMNGIQISLTGKERERLIDAVNCYIDIMTEGIETSKSLDIELNNGLGKAMFKLYKGLNGERQYIDYTQKK